MMNKKLIKVLSIILAALMALSAVAIIFSTIASASYGTPTGDNDLDTIVPIAVGVLAVAAVVVCLLLPKLKKKDS